MRRWLAVLVNLCLALGAVGCARSGGEDEGLLVVSDGAERTLEARTFRVTMSFGLPEDAHVSSGAVDLDRQLSWLGLGEGPDAEPEQISRGNTFYVRSDQLPRAFGATTPWIFYDHTGMAAAYETYRAEVEKNPPPGVDLELSPMLPLPEEMPSMIPGIPAAGGAGLFDPTQLLKQLREEAVRVDEEAREEVRGVPVTRYRVNLDERRLRREATAEAERQVAQLPASERKEMRKVLLEMARRPAPRRLWVWVDDHGLVRRLDLQERLDNEPGEDEEFRTRVELYDFGTPVTVAVPPSDQVTPMHTLPGIFHSPSLDVSATLASIREWQARTQGNVAGHDWFLEQGAAPDGTVCLRVRTDPPVQLVLSLPGPGGLDLPEGMEWPEGVEPPIPSGSPGPPDSPPPFDVPPVPEGLTLPDGLGLVPPTSGDGDCDDGWMAKPVYEQVTGSGPISYVYGQVPPRADSAEARFAGETVAAPITLHGDAWALAFDSSRRLDSVRFLRHGRLLVRCDGLGAGDSPTC